MHGCFSPKCACAGCHRRLKISRGIKNYLAEHQPQFAQSTVQRIYEGIRSLKNTPYRGRTGSTTGTRELVFTPLPYIVVYRIKDQTIEVLHIWHGAQKWP
ncbi:MAG: type II toxin-antitoxin system RelE/ParE family toxin [Acidobacteriaceae bacterium]|nr:type II toxin-antitoxin system RelE/ParE family toxin [Acidobacteriaceae bacterium]